MKTIGRATLTVGLLCGAFLCGGCPGPFHVEVALDEQDKGLQDKMGAVRSIEVNFIGVNDTELPRWEQMAVSGYWEPENPVRASAKKHVMTFAQGHPTKQVLKKSDPIWKTWLEERKAKHLVILAYMPWIQGDQPGAADPRRIILPLEAGQWEWYLFGADTIKIQLGAGGMTALTQPKKK